VLRRVRLSYTGARLDRTRGVGFRGSGISLPAQLSQEGFGGEVSVSVKEL